MHDRWKPDEKKVAQRKEYLESLFSKVNTKPDDIFITDCAKISIFLEDMDAVTSQLKKLNCMLKEKLDEANLVAGTKGSVKILRNILENELGDMGFHRRFGQVTRGIAHADFLATISKGLLLKDSAFRQDNHGELTHAIQWLLISWQNKEAPFLSEATINVFKKFGNSNTSTPDTNLWDEVVDANVLARNFRSPEILNLYILEHHQELNCLSKVLEHRAMKAKPSERKFNTPEKKQKYEQTKPGLFEPKASLTDSTTHDLKQTSETPKKS